jgi:ankyrin repeat protein
VTSLQAAALGGYVRVATILLDAGADTNGNRALRDGRTALEGAAEHGRIDMVQLLLDAGANLHGNGYMQYKTALQLASINGHNAVRRLIEDRYKSGIVGLEC